MFSVIFARRNLLLRRPEGRCAKVAGCPEAPRRPEVQAELHRRRGRAGRAGAREGRRSAGVRARRRAVGHLSLAKLANLAILAIFATFWRARSRLYQNESLQEYMPYLVTLFLHFAGSLGGRHGRLGTG